MQFLETRSEVKITVTQLWYATLPQSKMHPHTKFEIPTSNNIRDKNIQVREWTSFKTVNFHQQRAITTESLVRYGPLSNAGPRSAVGNVSGYRCVSDCRSRGREFDPGPVPYFCGD